MANEQKGIDGVVKIDAKDGTPAIILSVTSFSLEETSETLDVTSMNSVGDAREIIPTFTSFSGTVDGFWNEGDTKLIGASGAANGSEQAKPTVRAGVKIDFELYPGGESRGDPIVNHQYYFGTAIVTSVSRSASFDGAVEFSLAFDGTGALSYGTSAAAP